MITMTLEGGKELERKLLDLERKVAKKVRATAVRNAAKPVLTAAKANARALAGPGSDRKMSGAISKALQLKIGKSPKSRDDYYMRVQHNPKYNDILVSYSLGSAFALGTRSASGTIVPGKQISGQRYYIPNAIEYGHVKRGGSGMVPAKPYLRPAFDSNVHRAQNIMRHELFNRIEEAWRGR